MSKKEEKIKVNQLIRLKAFKPIHHPLLAFDTEDDSKGNFKLGYLYGFYYSHHKYRMIDRAFTNKKEMAEFLNKVRRIIIVGKNTDYDLCNLEPFIKVKKLYAKSHFVLGKNPKKAKYYDIQNHLDGSLEELMPLLGMSKVKGDVENFEGETLEERCRTDTVATFLLAQKIEDYYSQAGSKFNPTIGSCALEIFKRRFFKHFWRRDDRLNEFEREAYRGGRCEVFSTKEVMVNSYDINSTYVFIMAENKFPEPQSIVQYDNDNDFRYHFDRYQGIVKAQVYVPDMFYPPLPYYHPKMKKLIFPVGRFTGTWTFDELRYAESIGVKIEKVFKYVYYAHSYFYFRDFALWVWQERRKATNKFDDAMIKKIGNSLYGKFGQMNEKQIYYGKLEDFDGELKDGMTPLITEVGGVEYLSLTGGKKVNSHHTFVTISAHVAAFARIELHKEMIKHQTVYTDTDNIKILDEMVSSGELGGWKFEGNYKFKAYRPKLYEYKGKLKAKGIPQRKSDKNLSLVVKDGVLCARFTKPYKFKEALRNRKAFNLWEIRHKELSLFDDKRLKSNEFDTLPIKLS